MFRYHTDPNDVIVSLNEAFVLFAKENWRPDFEPSNLIGERLSANITDPSTRHLYTLLLSRLKENPRPFTLPYRCDSPRREAIHGIDHYALAGQKR